VGANVHSEDLFEGIWPIPNGIALNAYVVKGEEIALVELVREWGGAAMTLIENLNTLDISVEDIDYIVLNHLEPDHTGFSYLVKSLAPNAEMVTTEKGAALLEGFYGIDDNISIVKSGDSLELGKNKEFKFIEIPFVHWPETMATYEVNSRILFPGDAFGAFGVHRGGIFDDETPDVHKNYWEQEMLRYYSNIISAFSTNVLKAIDSLSSFEIKVVAPSHGLVWRGKPEVVIKKYERYANYNKDFAEPEICIIWGSMYGNTEVMLHTILRSLADKGITMNVHRVPNEDISFILSDAYKAAGLIIGAPTYEYGLFPPMKYFLEILKKKRFWYKKVFYFGSYGWSGGGEREFGELSEKMHWDILDPITFRGHPTREELEIGEKRALELAQMVKEIPVKTGNEEY
jgi:flavorubredoxin